MVLSAMAFTIKILTLFKDFYYSKDSTNTEESLTLYKNAVKKGETNPAIDDFLTEEFFCGNICSGESEFAINKGRYLFIQGIFTSHETVQDAAQELYLESLWQELSFTDDIVYMRKLEEDGKTVFQLFRKIQ
jgi:predicted ATPase